MAPRILSGPRHGHCSRHASAKPPFLKDYSGGQGIMRKILPGVSFHFTRLAANLNHSLTTFA
jgi:hypothetical protein